MLIDCSYFTDGPRHIQNASLGRLPNANAQLVNEAINAYIKTFQFPFLKGVLGAPLAGAVTTYLKMLDKLPEEEPDEDLEMVMEQLREPFANYVFFKILRDSNTQATMTGLVRLKCANEYVAPIRRQVTIWNDMVEMLSGFNEWSKSEDCTVAGIVTDSNFLTRINVLNL